jgi:hypothetical protein
VEVQGHGGNEEGAQREHLLMRLTARGPVIEEREGWNVLGGLDIGREAIVKSFKMLTSDEARRFWKEQG